MSAEDNKARLRAYVEDIVHGRRPGAADEYLDSDAVLREPYTPLPTYQGIDPYVLDLLRGHQPEAADEYLQRKEVPPEAAEPASGGGHARRVGELIAAFPDLVFDAEEVIAEGDTVVARFRASGTHSGASFLGARPSGRRIELDLLVLYRFRAGKIVEIWPFFNELLLRQRLGIVAPGRAAEAVP